MRERFHLMMLLLAVSLQTMKEYAWRADRLTVLLPDCILLLIAEIIVDWVRLFVSLPPTTVKFYTEVQVTLTDKVYFPSKFKSLEKKNEIPPQQASECGSEMNEKVSVHLLTIFLLFCR